MPSRKGQTVVVWAGMGEEGMTNQRYFDEKEQSMDWLLLVSGVLAGFTTVGHFLVGSRNFLHPMLQASFDEISKKVMHCVFHYISVYLILSTVVLLLLGFGIDCGMDAIFLVKFIAVQYLLFAVTQLVIAFTSQIDRAVFKLFQWTFFVLIAVFAWLGVS